MVSERDIWAAASILVERYGDDAESHAAQRAEELFDRGDLEEHCAWRRILEAVKQLKDTERPKDARLH